ncbi:hypothetical protein [Marinobacter nauticus]|uniref:Uncharacterized protein n=1 Tax=Marinobacter nauticus TaxID=2743 RepID=A0A368UMR1_MARNT|nr:hypothetical protein [Marinobacter nauticus]RBP68625.1 hypothetical protein DET64_11814 [Marinobacter nauticus]RCW29983.1 hypothetical protein DET51_11814 [Marinobacter nauticus]
MSMKDAMAKAYEKAGKKLPVSHKKRNKKRRPSKVRDHKRPVEVKQEWSKDSKPVVRRQRISEEGLDSRAPKAPPQPAKPATYEVDIAPDAAATFSANDNRSSHCLLVESTENLSGMLGIMNAAAPEEELFLGFDLGTSSLKAVVGDRNRRVHYAVPFRDAVGIDQYLLPTRLYQTSGIYTLEGVSQPDYQNLKLDLMEDPTNNQARQRLVAFIALSLRQISAWFQKAHGNTYGKSNLLWSLNVGVPAAESGRLSDVMELLGWAGWIAAASEAPIDDELIGKAMERAEKLMNGAVDPDPSEDVEVGTIPEIAAQIYGYVRSDAFDPNAQNLFILADVGAGTVDCAMFKVRPAKHSEEFLFYEKSVEPLGVTSLHIHRLKWWHEVFAELEHSPDALVGAIEAELKQIDATRPIPDKFSKYFYGVTVKSSPKGPLGLHNPDAEFDQRLRAQIQDGTLEKGRQSGGWHVEALKDTPFLLSGGGSRNKYYERIKEGLRHHPSLGYLRLNPKPLVLPSNIKAPGLARQDWDRLSVAYGLSFGSVGKATFVPAVNT